jgi:hypothetical protein
MKPPIVLAVLSVVALGCLDERTPGPATSPVAGSSNGVAQAVVLLEPGATATNAVLTVRVLSADMTLGAYQGAVTFDAGAFELIEASLPTAASGQFNVVNTGSVAAGVIRFAGYATERFATTEAFHLRVRPKRDLSQVSFVARLDAVGTMTGASLNKSRLLAGPGLREASSGRVLRR